MPRTKIPANHPVSDPVIGAQFLSVKRKKNGLIKRAWFHDGLACVAMQNMYANTGYVYVPEDHPWRQIPESIAWSYMEKPISELEVHGGVTYFRDWWVGWDAAHGFDVWSPADVGYGNTGVGGAIRDTFLENFRIAKSTGSMAVDWDWNRLYAETEQLADQIKNAEVTSG